MLFLSSVSFYYIYFTFSNIFKFNGATYNSKFTGSYGGGVGRNIAEGLSKLHGNVEFISKVGNDQVKHDLRFVR